MLLDLLQLQDLAQNFVKTLDFLHSDVPTTLQWLARSNTASMDLGLRPTKLHSAVLLLGIRLG